jgi:hypothetical protein
MNAKLTLAFAVLLQLTIAVAAQTAPLQCSGSNLHLSLATAGSSTVSTSTGFGVVMFGMSNPASCVTQGVAYIVGATSDPSTADYYGWALVCVNVPGCAGGTVVATTGSVTGAIFSPVAKVSQFLNWTTCTPSCPVTIQPGIYGLVLGTTCSSSCATLYGDVARGSWYPFVQAGTGTSGSYPWSFGNGGFGVFANVPPTTGIPVLGTAAGPAPPTAILY